MGPRLCLGGSGSAIFVRYDQLSQEYTIIAVYMQSEGNDPISLVRSLRPYYVVLAGIAALSRDWETVFKAV